MRIGITEAGDAGIDLSWVDKLDTVDGAILVTKNITPYFTEAVAHHRDKLIIHATCTGYGGTLIEPNVPPYAKQLAAAYSLVERGMPFDRVVIRIDPIIPTVNGLKTAKEVFRYAYRMGFRRFRISVLDMYPHVRSRFSDAGLPLPYGDAFTASDEQFAAVDKMLSEIKRACPEAVIMCCAEPKLKVPRKIGCVSEYDLDLLGIEAEDIKPNYQRKDCLCIGNKTELLTHKGRCPHRCLYCYWKD